MIDARNFAVEETLRNGMRATTRAARPDDRARLVRAFHELDPKSIFMRFFTEKTEVTEAELHQLDTMDFTADVGLVVTIPRGDDEIIIGGARYVAFESDDGARAAEIAFTVEEDYQRLGIAGRLLEHLAAIAREHAIVRFEADVLAANKPMLRVFERSGRTIRKDRRGDAWHLTLTTAPTPPRPA